MEARLPGDELEEREERGDGAEQAAELAEEDSRPTVSSSNHGMDRKVLLAARVRPMSERELAVKSEMCVRVDCDNGYLALMDPETREAKVFVLDHVYDSSAPPGRPDSQRGASYASNRSVFADLGKVCMQSLMGGYNAAVVLYGQEGTGRTHTMLGHEADPGLLPRLLEDMVDLAEVQDGKWAVRGSVYKIESERVLDLLSRDPTRKLTVRSNASATGSEVVGLTWKLLAGSEDCEELVNLVHRSCKLHSDAATLLCSLELCSRVYRPHPHPNRSSVEELKCLSKLHLVRLSRKSGAEDSAMMKALKVPQAVSVDKSVLAWSTVMSALAEKQLLMSQGRLADQSAPHVPFRSSLLTRVLEDSLGHQARVVVVATVSPSSSAYRESMHTFRHVVRSKEVKRMKTNPELLHTYSHIPEFIPSAGGGWRWAYSTRVTIDKEQSERLSPK
uniref:Kinesin motor domain-containing protein n=1 Tax=Hanusia phi TaxID=3032 RepID=A0A7S0HP74_9CRYP